LLATYPSPCGPNFGNIDQLPSFDSLRITQSFILLALGMGLRIALYETGGDNVETLLVPAGFS
jgi:hypothetical protein